MGRGYSAHRSHSKRLTNKTKRSRSSSVQQLKQELVHSKPPQHHTKRDPSASAGPSDAITNVEASTAKRRGISSEKRDADALAATGRTRSESLSKVVYLGNKMVRTVNITRHFSNKKVAKPKAPKGSDDDSASGESEIEYEDKEVHEDFIDDDEPSEDESETIRRTDVFTKYVEGGKVVDAVLAVVAEACVPGASTKALCFLGDSEIFNRIRGMFKNTSDGKAMSKVAEGGNGKRSASTASRARSGVANFDRSRSSGSRSYRGRSQSANPLAVRFDQGIPRGVAFPTTVSVNEVLCNHTPFADDEATILKPSDVVKIHCGVHLDGYPVSAARTIVVQPGVAIGAEDPNAAITPLPATAVNAIEASRVALAGAIHLMRPGAVNDDITDFIASVGAHYQSEAIEGVLSTRSKRWILDSVSSSIICRRVTGVNPQQDVALCEVEPFQVWALDIAFTNSSSYRMGVVEGLRPNSHCNIYRKNEISSANPTLDDLRSKAASHLLTQEIRTKFHCFPFNPLHAEEPLQAKLGLHALKRGGQIDSFSELACKANSAEDSKGYISKKSPTNDNRAITARFCATVAITEKRVHVLCGGAGVISDEFLSKKKAKDHKSAAKAGANGSSTSDIGGFLDTCGGLATFEQLYGAAFPTAAFNTVSSEFESEEITNPLYVRTPTDQLKGLLSSPLNFGKSIVTDEAVAAVAASANKGSTTVHAQEDEVEAEMTREDVTAKRKQRRTEAPADNKPQMDEAAKSKLLSMHPGRKPAKK